LLNSENTSALGDGDGVEDSDARAEKLKAKAEKRFKGMK